MVRAPQRDRAVVVQVGFVHAELIRDGRPHVRRDVERQRHRAGPELFHEARPDFAGVAGVAWRIITASEVDGERLAAGSAANRLKPCDGPRPIQPPGGAVNRLRGQHHDAPAADHLDGARHLCVVIANLENRDYRCGHVPCDYMGGARACQVGE